ncbi:MAG: F0F1 ATP synthase subunit epsilon [Prevotellaceae bacterium]|jgi:F-type H+-transporting ATPase subunit epsilon|nr:F0F1 ATP synthase subunit epsilon [Prevotellaceae bacterium]
MKFQIITPNDIAVQEEVTQVSLPGAVGNFMVLHNHAPLISTLVKGKITYRTNEKTNETEIEQGVVEIKENVIRVFTEQVIQGGDENEA